MSAPLRDPRSIVIYRLDEPDATTADDLRRRHRKLGYFDIRYHVLIERGGSRVNGRPVTECACHHKPQLNNRALAVALIGTESNAAQDFVLVEVLEGLLIDFPHAVVIDDQAQQRSATHVAEVHCARPPEAGPDDHGA